MFKLSRCIVQSNIRTISAGAHPRLAFLSNFHSNCILLSSSNKNLCGLGFWPRGEVPGGLGLFLVGCEVYNPFVQSEIEKSYFHIVILYFVMRTTKTFSLYCDKVGGGGN